MRDAILMVLLSVVSVGAAAEWVKAGDNRIATIYVDPGTISKSGNIVKMWYLFDFKAAQSVRGMRLLSQKAQSEFDCQGERMRMLAFSYHPANMGGGAPLYSVSDPDPWEPIPNPINQTTWEIACGRH